MSTLTAEKERLPNDPPVQPMDYSLIGTESKRAIEQGLAEADWYTTPIPREELKQLLTRRDWPAIRDCFIYFGLIAFFGVATYSLWGSWWAFLPMMAYGILWASASDARWHESSHGTAFKTDWLNNLLYEVASFMVLRESVPWRWSHTRHHSDTIIVGRDPEIAVPRPPNLRQMLLKCINFQAFRRYLKNITLHSLGRVAAEEAAFIPESEYPKVFLRARIYATIYLAIIALAIVYQTWLPFVFVLGPNLYGAWLMPIYGWTQHAGLAENVLDHRLNCRTISMNFVHRFLYWNMNYHLEHHMFPLVPYHQLPNLHQLIKDDCPAPYPGLIAAYKEIIPTVLRQIKDPGYYVKRSLPASAKSTRNHDNRNSTIEARDTGSGWLDLGAADRLYPNEITRLDHAGRTYAIYRTKSGHYYATDGICTHGNTHLADGFLKGETIECPKHNGRFNIKDGAAVRHPACVALKTYPVKADGGRLLINLEAASGLGAKEQAYQLRVVRSQYVATFIKEIVLEPAEENGLPDYQPGQYLQFEIPAFNEISFSNFNVPEPYSSVWKANHLFDYCSTNSAIIRRNYSLATSPQAAKNELRFNVRIATPPRGLDCDAGVGSSYMHSLSAGDIVTVYGPYGDFEIKDSEREMVYIGGGAGMAPLRSHISHLFNTLRTKRTVSYWYGARSKQEVFYEEYFRALEKSFPNFTFHIALSEPQENDNWDGPTGFIHEVVRERLLSEHPNPEGLEYYLCGPPPMIQATQSMLTDEWGVSQNNIAFDEF
ncbi:MAG: NADH:ubiquinone reductase (Na(+)-transporting) subunit F [Verrucomicrobiota bacterium]